MICRLVCPDVLLQLDSLVLKDNLGQLGPFLAGNQILGYLPVVSLALRQKLRLLRQQRSLRSLLFYLCNQLGAISAARP